MPDLTTIGLIVAIVTGVGGLLLGIWNRIEQWREYRERRKAREPHFEVFASTHADNDGWCPLQFKFYNPSETAFFVETMRVVGRVVIAPAKELGIGIVTYSGISTEPDPSRASHSAGVGWKIEAEADGVSPTPRVFWRPTSDPTSFSVRVTAREISATRRKFHMHAEAIVKIATP
jgi:hypothetical protein